MILTLFIIIFIAVPAIVLHECAHGWVAYKLGDPTAKRLGRLTLNPLSHVDPVGTIVVPALLYLAYALHLTPTLFMFGWAKPVPVNFHALPNPRRDKILVALAGPVTNILVAACLAQLIRTGFLSWIDEFLFYGVLLNLTLAIFNLIPIPPLDGSRVVSGLIPARWDRYYSALEPFGIIIVVVLLNFGWLSVISPFVTGLMRFMGLN